MSISGISGGDPTSPQGGPSNQIKGTQDEFLRLFMAQLQHQDPFAPTSGADMVAQLAQLSAVEQAKSTNAQLAELAAAQNSSANAALSSLVGRACDASVGAFELDGKGSAPPPISVHGDGPTKGAAMVITDANGKEVRRVRIPDGTRDTTLAWDGKDGAGNSLASGSYSISIDAGSSPAITASWHGTVDAVELTDGGPRLRMGSLLLAPGDIRTIGAST